MTGLQLTRLAMAQLGSISFEPDQQADDLVFALAALDNLGLLIARGEQHPWTGLQDLVIDDTQVRHPAEVGT